jgi:hypothetical protein
MGINEVKGIVKSVSKFMQRYNGEGGGIYTDKQRKRSLEKRRERKRERKRQFVKLRRRGLPVKEIASRLGVSPKTVYGYNKEIPDTDKSDSTIINNIDSLYTSPLPPYQPDTKVKGYRLNPGKSYGIAPDTS